MIIAHNTGTTIDLINKYLTPILGAQHLSVMPAKEHDGRDGIPVDAVEVSGVGTIYPFQGTAKSIAGPRPVLRWAVDTYLDASDPSVGLYGWEPVEHSDHGTVESAIIEIAQMVLAHRLQAQMEADYYAGEAECFYREQQAAEQSHFERFGA